MFQAWETIRVFISSTFQDMTAERDHLVRFVFPELREWCAKRCLHVVDIDLRWGVTETEAEQGRALEICLDEVDRCHFFIGFLGERYGAVLPQYAAPNEPRYDWLRDFEPGNSITALEIHHGILRRDGLQRRAFFYFRDPGFLATVPEDQRAVFQSENSEVAQKLKRLKEEIRVRCPVFNYSCTCGGPDQYGNPTVTSLDSLGQRVLDNLREGISAEHPETDTSPDELAVERAYHEAFIENRARRFIGRQDLLARVTAYAQSTVPSPLVITGPAGGGKSALMAKFAQEYAAAQPEVLVLAHFIGASPGSTDVRRTLYRLCCELARYFDINDRLPEDYEELRQVFPRFLEQAVEHKTVVLLIDALNQLDITNYATSALTWLPQDLPTGLRLIVSTLEGDCLDALRRRGLALAEITVSGLALEESRQLVRQTLCDYRKKLDESTANDQMGLLLSKRGSDNPLYLFIACEELRVFGAFAKVTDRIASLANTVSELLEQVLERLEHHHGRRLVQSAVSLLACCRSGLSEAEMLELLGMEVPLPRVAWLRLYRNLQFCLRPPGETGEGTLAFFHEQVAVAVHQRYLHSDDLQRAEHHRLAGYFRRKTDPVRDETWMGKYSRGLDVLPFHLIKAELWPELCKLLTDVRFLERKIADTGIAEETVLHGKHVRLHGGLLLLQNDFSLALQQLLTEGTEWRETHLLLWTMLRVLENTGHKLRANATLVYQEVVNTLNGMTTVPKQLRTLINRSTAPFPFIKRCQGTSDIGLAMRQSIFATTDIVACDLHASRPLVLLASSDRVSIYDLEANRMAGELFAEGPINDCRFLSQRDELVIISDRVGTIWDLGRGIQCGELIGHDGMITQCDISSDGNLIATASTDRSCRIWDRVTGTCIHTLSDHSGHVTCCRFHPSGRYVLTGTRDRHVRLWELDSEEVVRQYLWPEVAEQSTARAIAMREFMWFLDAVEALAFDGGGTLFTACTTQGSLCLWDTHSPNARNALATGGNPLTSCAVRADGAIVFASDAVGQLLAWRLDSCAPVARVKAHARTVNRIVCQDGRGLLATCSADGSVRLWDPRFLVSGESNPCHDRAVTFLSGHLHKGHQALSAGDDGRIILWDVDRGVAIHEMGSHQGAVLSAAIDHRGGIAVTTGDDGRVKMWALNGTSNLRREVRLDEPALCCSVSGSGQLIAFGSMDGWCHVYGVADCELLRKFQAHQDCIRSCSFVSDQCIVTIADGDGIALSHWQGGFNSQHARFRIGGNVCQRAASRTGKILLCLTNETVVLDASDAVFFPHGIRNASSCCFSADERLVAIAGQVGDEVGVSIIDYHSRKPYRFISCADDSPVACMFLSDGTRCVTGSREGLISVWGLGTGQRQASFYCDAGVSCLADVPSRGKHFMAGDQRGGIYMLELVGDE